MDIGDQHFQKIEELFKPSKNVSKHHLTFRKENKNMAVRQNMKTVRGI